MTLFRCQLIYLAGRRPTNWGHHLYHSKVDGGLSYDRQIHTQTQKSPRAYGLTSLSEKTRRSNHLQMLEQKQHLLLNYFKTLSVGPSQFCIYWVGNRLHMEKNFTADVSDCSSSSE